jgi:cytoskeletal protein RodZ
MNDPLDEQDLIARYRALPRPEPSAALDAAVLAQARAAVRRTRPAWMTPLAAAAVVVLAVAVGWQLRGVPWEPLAPLPPDEVAPTSDAAAGASATGPAANQAVEIKQTPTMPPAEPAATPAPLAAPAPTAVGAAKAEREQPAGLQNPPTAASPPAAARAATVPAPPAAPPPPPAEPAPRAEPWAKRQRAEAAPAPPAPAAPPAPPMVAAPADAPMAAEATMAEERIAPLSDAADLELAAWIDAIRRLRDAGDVIAARREVERLRLRHPDFELPPDLRDLHE